ncbi:phage virion morphogenesis protein [Desulfotruncus alcoholivorax]|uniref:phage virion morphogenesis protein n=1 Tax=Desulfotruncus alcoholivorax TaxID=265477 RepID=UPI000488B812|nr:phage virion morphogenesis protein [Desulfotruncus alcoholivorax]
MSGIRLEGDWSRLERGMHRLARLNFTALHKEIGEYLVTSTAERFKTETGPDGRKWPPSIRARTEGGQTLTDTTTLKNSISYRARPDKVIVGTMDKRASTHQTGRRIKVKRSRYLHFKVGGKWVKKKEVQIPARPFIGINDDDRTEIDKIISDAIEECFR